MYYGYMEVPIRRKGMLVSGGLAEKSTVTKVRESGDRRRRMEAKKDKSESEAYDGCI